jgi:hypothetical protein
MRLALLQARIRRHLMEPFDLRGAAHHEDPVGRHSAPPLGHRAVALVRGDDPVGSTEGGSLRPPHRPVEQVLTAPEPGLVQLGHQVVLVEQETGAAALERHGDQEEQVRRVAGVYDVDGTDLPGQAVCLP